MADKKYTLLELHLDGNTQFGPRSIGGEEEEETETIEESTAIDEDEETSGSRAGSAVKAFAVLAVVALAARAISRRFGGVPDDVSESIEVGTDEVESAAE